MVARYFAYGSNMNPERVRERGIRFHHVSRASLTGFALAFDKTSRYHAGIGHANLRFEPEGLVEGVLYWLESPVEISKMDRFERTPVNYSREVITVSVPSTDLPTGRGATAPDGASAIETWTYFANPAVRRPDLVPPRSYLNHLLAGRPFLSEPYYRMLESWPCEESR